MQVNALSSSSASAAVVQAGYRASRSVELQVMTAEGDLVTLSAASTRAVGGAAAYGESGGTSVSAGAVTVSAEDEASATVVGELSHEELVDLQKVVKAFEKAAARGDASKLLERLSRPDLDTIAMVAGSSTTEMTATATLVTGWSAGAADAPA